MQLHVDWFRVLDDLKRRGFSLYMLEVQVGIPKSTLVGYKQGSEPKHMDGERLIQFWCQVTTNERSAIPTAPVALSVARSKI